MREPEVIEGAEDPRLAAFADLRRGRTDDLAIVEGAIPAQRALASGYPVPTLVCTPSHVPRLRDSVGADTRWLCAPKAVLAEVAGFAFHRGVLATVRTPQPAPTSADVLERLARAPTVRIAAALGLGDPSNVGALIRAARAFAVDLVVLGAGAADAFGRKAIRASAGQIFTQPLVVCPDPWAEVERLRTALSATVFATTPAGEMSLRNVAPPAASIVAFGPEGPGLAPHQLAAADVRLRIPMAPGVDSLNVAACSAVAFYALAPTSRRAQPPT